MDDLVKKLSYKHRGLTPNIINESIMLFNINDMDIDKFTVLNKKITFYFKYPVIISDRVNDMLLDKFNIIKG